MKPTQSEKKKKKQKKELQRTNIKAIIYYPIFRARGRTVPLMPRFPLHPPKVGRATLPRPTGVSAYFANFAELTKKAFFMTQKIFDSLKRAYASLGLDENFLMAHATTLEALGLVTEENLESVVSAQKPLLEAAQKENDRRVSEAVQKTRKAVEDEKKAQEEAEAKIRAEKQAAQKEKEEKDRKTSEQKELERLRKEAEEARRKAEELAASQAATEKEKREAVELAAKLESEARARAEKEASEKAESEKSDMQRQIDALRKAAGEVPGWYEREKEAQETQLSALRKSVESLLAENRKLSEGVTSLKSRNDELEKTQRSAAHRAMIDGKVRELGIPQWRVDEGFTLTEESTEQEVTDYLTRVAQNLRTQMLPPKGAAAVLPDDKPSEQDVREIAKLMVN